MAIDVRAKLAEKGLTLPVAAKPVAAYLPAVRTGQIVFTAGQLPLVNGAMADTGKVGAEITQERAKELAEICALNCLAAVELVAPVDMIVKVVRVVCYVNGAPGFLNQPFIANGASELFMHIWGDAGIAARSAIGVAELPLNSPVEIELTVEIAELKGSSANVYLGGQHQQSILNDRPA
jgi:enamine deaminase RidA (YjgF/YER057c/UK114 family)